MNYVLTNQISLMRHFTSTLFLAAALAAALPASGATENDKTVYINTSSNRAELSAATLKTSNIQMFRSLYAGYNTLCLPYDLTADEVTATFGDVQLERLAGCKQNGAVLELYFTDCTSEGVQAGMPYLIYSPVRKSAWIKTGAAPASLKDAQPVTVSDTEGNRVTFRGVFKTEEPVGLYGIPAAQALEGEVKSILVRTDGSKHFLPTRCGLDWDMRSNSATELVIKHVASTEALGNTTGISTLQAQDAVVDVYSLNGTLVKAGIRISEATRTLPKGIYVINGEKFLVK